MTRSDAPFPETLVGQFSLLDEIVKLGQLLTAAVATAVSVLPVEEASVCAPVRFTKSSKQSNFSRHGSFSGTALKSYPKLYQYRENIFSAPCPKDSHILRLCGTMRR